MSARTVLHTIHRWVGLSLCVPLVVLGLTGSVLVFEHELGALFDPSPRASAPGAAPSIDATVAAARAVAPADTAPTVLIAPSEPLDPAVVRFAPKRGEPGAGTVQVFVDPASLAVLDVRAGDPGLLRWIFRLHANLTTHDRSGRAIVGWLGGAMTFFGFSGIVLWWPAQGQWRRAFTVQRGARGFRLFRQLHGAAGIWGLAVFLTVSVSGTYLAFPQTLGGAVATVLPARDLRSAPTVARPEGGARPRSVDDAIAAVRAALPDGALRMIGFPVRPDQPLRLSFARPGDAAGQPLVTLFVDPYRAQVIERRDPAAFSAGETVLAWQHALHSGRGVGWLWQGLVCVCGLLPALFATSGIAMWLITRRARRRPALRTLAAEPAE
jgi:uncharacterized iron-regulated membrane protein